jgi:hypothetical protein
MSTVVPGAFSLGQNYPNPFNPSTTIAYELPVGVNVSMKLYDMLGREVLSLVDGFRDAGHYEVTVDGSRLAAGIYYYRITAGSFIEVKELLLLK